MTMHIWERNPDRPRVDALLGLAARGIFTLPDEVAEAQRIEADIKRQIEALGNIDSGHVPALIEELAERIARGKAPADLTRPIAQARAEQERAEILGQALRTARLKAESRLIAQMRDAAPGIHREQLQPGFTKQLDRIRQLEPALRGLDVSNAAQFVDINDERRKPYIALRHAADQLEGIWEARRVIRDLTGRPKRDTNEEFSVIRDPRSVWGAAWRGRHIANSKPWPTDRLAYVLWLSTQDAWLPTAEEQGEAYRAMVDAGA